MFESYLQCVAAVMVSPQLGRHRRSAWGREYEKGKGKLRGMERGVVV
jgi:hypothetical protein